jgi:hypothetical protein
VNAPTIGADIFTDDFLEKLRQRMDRPADDAVAAFAEQEAFIDRKVGSHPKRLMEAMIRHAPGSDEASKHLGAFVAERPTLPTWADPDLLERGQEVFGEYLPQLGLALWMASIPAGYAGARDVVVLNRTHQLVSEPKRRFLETGQFVLDVMTPGGLGDHGQGSADIRHVRLMHAAVRRMLLHDAKTLEIEPWDTNSGMPINQEALLATMFTFSIVGLESLEKFGVNLSPDEREAYVHVWSIIGHLMGIDDDLLPLDFADSTKVWNTIKAKEYGPSPEGKELTAHAIEVMQALVPNSLGAGLPASGIRFLLGDDTADLLGVPPANWSRVVFLPSRTLGSLMSRFQRHSRTGRWVTERLGRAVMKEFLEHNRSERPAFDVPQQFRRQLGLET